MSDPFPAVYAELRRLAAAKLAAEPAGHTLDATALVHEAYLRLGAASFGSRSGFFRAAAEAMRRILVDHARAKRAAKRGGDRLRADLPDVAGADPDSDLLALDEALADLDRHDPAAAELVKLRYFSGFTHADAAALLGLTRRQADGLWAVARAWLYRRLRGGEGPSL
ncbi:MAG: RNA polymerase subunit sigma [Gemmataceae bacterium]|nr:RNA polymerase subunit sigma [Gemmataceae bacterium]